MNQMKNRLGNIRGVTFIEIMIALVLVAIVTTGVFNLFIAQHDSYMVQEDVTDVQQNARASIDELSRNIRMAGYDLPLGLNAIEAYDTDPDTIVVVYHSSGCDTYLSDPMPNPSAELKVSGDLSCFYEGQFVFIYDPDSAVGEWMEISLIQQAAFHIQHRESSLSRAYQADALVLALDRVKYFVDNTTDPDHPSLMVQRQGQVPQVFAENISEIQFRYQMKSGQILDEPAIAENIRQVLIDVIGRSNIPQYGTEGDQTFRERDFATSVFLRNVGI